MHAFRHITFITSLIIPIAVFIAIVSIYIRFFRATIRRGRNLQKHEERQNSFDSHLTKQVQKTDNLKGLFANENSFNDEEQQKEFSSTRCPNCGAMMDQKGKMLECSFCGTKKR